MQITQNEQIIHAPLFTGFYHSHYDSAEQDYDYEANEMLSMYNEANKADYTNNDIFDVDIDHTQWNKDISEAYTSSLEEWLREYDLINSLEFIEVDSPKYYNFEADKIVCKVQYTSKQMGRWVGLLSNHQSEFREYLSVNYKSRDGFISFIEHDYDSFIRELYKEDSRYIMIALEFLLPILYKINHSANDYDTIQDTFITEVLCDSDIHISFYINYVDLDDGVKIKPEDVY